MKKTALLTLAALVLIGCNATKTSTPETEQAKDLSGEWVITSLEKNGIVQQIVESNINLEKISQDTYNATGNSGINQFFGTVKIDAGTFTTDDKMASTKMAGSPEAMAFEDDFLSILTGADKIQLSEDGKCLVLTDDDTKSSLTFTQKNNAK